MKYEFTVYMQVECKLTVTVKLLLKWLASQLPAILTVKLRSYFLQCTPTYHISVMVAATRCVSFDKQAPSIRCFTQREV